MTSYRCLVHEENWLWARLEFAHYLALIVYFISSKKWVQKKSIQITHIYGTHDHHHLSGTCNISPPLCQHHMPFTTSSYLPTLQQPVISTQGASKVCGCYSIRLTCTIRFTQQILTCASADLWWSNIKKLALIYLWLSEVHVCYFLHWTHACSQLCLLL